MSSRLRWTARLLLAVAVLAATAGSAAAADRTYSSSFNWNGDAMVGYAGWMFQEFGGNGETNPPHRYTGTTGPDSTYGPGLTIRPGGDPTQIYPDGASGRYTFLTPGASPATQVTARSVIYSLLKQTVKDKQGVRLRLGVGGEFLDDDLNADDSTQADRATPDVPLPKPGYTGGDSRSLSIWMFSEPCQPTNAITCRPADPIHGGVNHVGRAELTLVDHEAPTITPSGPAYAQRSRWVPGTPDGLTVAASDPGSGVKNYQVKTTGPGGTHSVLSRTLPCDPKHIGATSQDCPIDPGPSTLTRGQIGALPTGITTFTATAKDRAGQVSPLLRWTLKVDRRPPSTPSAPRLAALDGTFVPTTRKLVVPVTATDTHSGVLDISADVRDSSGTETTAITRGCTTSAAQCPHIARGNLLIDLSAAPTGITTVTVRVHDLVGNTSALRPVRLRVDRLPPPVVKLRAAPSSRRPTAVTWEPVIDRGGSRTAFYEYRERADSPFARVGQFVKAPANRRLPVLVSTAGLVVEVRAVDHVGNTGPIATAYLHPGLQGVQFGLGSDLKDLLNHLPHLPSFATGARLLCAVVGQVDSDYGKKCKQVVKYIQQLNTDAIGGFICGESELCAEALRVSVGELFGKKFNRDSLAWLGGEIISGFLLVGDLRDALVAAAHGDSTDFALSAFGAIPFAGDAAKSASDAVKFAKRTKRAEGRVPELLDETARVTGTDSKATAQIADKLTEDGFGRIRAGGVSFQGEKQLIKSGNDIGALSKAARLTKETFNSQEAAQLEKDIDTYWPKVRTSLTKRGRLLALAEARGVESSLAILKRNGYEILYDGRPLKGRPRHGPDILAKRDGKLVVVESKGTTREDSPLTLKKVTSALGRSGNKEDYVQPSPEWLSPNANRRYLGYFGRSAANPGEKEAYRLLTDVLDNNASYDAAIVHVRPAQGVAYGSGIDRAARLIKMNGQVKNLFVLDVPFG